MALSEKIISEEIKKEIAKLSWQNKQDDIFNYLKPKLESGEVLPQDVYDYAEKYYWPKRPGTPRVVHADTINKLGVVLGSLQDKNKNLLASQFYFLAAQRDSAWGCRNYAQCALSGINGAEKPNETALEYAKKAVELTQNTPEKNQHKDIYARALKANGCDYSLSFTTMIDYLISVALQKNQDNNIKNAVDFCNQLIEEMLADFQEGNFDYELAKEHFQAPLLALQSIISCRGNHQELLALRSKACFLAGQYYEALKMDSKAWITYCQAKDKSLPYYEEVVNARKILLKNFITQQFEALIVSTISVENLVLDDADVALKPQKKPESTLLLPNGIPLSLNFSKFWNKDTSWFHSVNEMALKNRYDKHLQQIGSLIEAKKQEIILVKKAIRKDLLKPPESEAREIALESELLQLQKIETKTKDRYQLYLADSRKIFRSHQVETHFFDPKHFKKQTVLEKLKELTFGIIDQRFSLDKSALSPLNLAEISSRMLITAERVFQEAVIALSGEASVVLGIPRGRGNYWEIDYRSGTNWLGVVERYQVANTEIQAEHRTSPKRQRLGDSFMPQHGKYSGAIYPFLRKLSAGNSDNEKLIAKYLIRFSKSHQPMILDELQNFYQSADENDVNHFNQIAFLVMEKEQAQWHSATDKDYQLGMTVAQSRALIMLEAGFLSLEETFKNDVMFGVYSQTGILNSPDKVAKACKRIDELYTSFFLNQRQGDSMRFFKLQIKNEEKRIPVLTRQQIRSDLHYVYGGETESDGDGYDTDLGM